MSAKQDIYRNASTLTAKKQVPRRTSTTVPATSASLSSAAHPSAGCATLSASCCPNRLRMELPNEACITCAHAMPPLLRYLHAITSNHAISPRRLE